MSNTQWVLIYKYDNLVVHADMMQSKFDKNFYLTSEEISSLLMVTKGQPFWDKLDLIEDTFFNINKQFIDVDKIEFISLTEINKADIMPINNASIIVDATFMKEIRETICLVFDEIKENHVFECELGINGEMPEWYDDNVDEENNETLDTDNHLEYCDFLGCLIEEKYIIYINMMSNTFAENLQQYDETILTLSRKLWMSYKGVSVDEYEGQYKLDVIPIGIMPFELSANDIPLIEYNIDDYYILRNPTNKLCISQ